MKSINFLIIATLTYVMGFTVGCKKSADIQPGPSTYPPIVSTKPATNISSTSIVSGGEIVSTTNITDKGVIWGTDSSVLSISNINKTNKGAGLSNFTDTVQNLQPNTAYYLRAYAIYSSGVAYGAAIRFTTLPPQPNVYVAGYHNSSAAYWKNGKLIILPNGTYAHSIFVVGNDVFVAGDGNAASGSQRAVYWKNGIQVPLTDGTKSARALSIFVVGNDVFVAGYEIFNNNANFPVTKYWKNGVAVPLVNGISTTGIANSIYVAGNDVFVAGWMSLQSGYRVATYWKNGIAFPLTNTTTTISSAESILVKGNDVYVCGTVQSQAGVFGGTPVATYWKNGQPISLTDGSQHATAYSITVNGSDVYAAGYEYSSLSSYSIAKYWKNGISVSLYDGTLYGNAQSVYVADSDVYVAGSEDNGYNSRRARCWRNGVALPLEVNAQYSTAVSVFVQ